MKLSTFFDLMDGEFQIRQVETEEILFDSYDDSHTIFEKYKNFKIVGFSIVSKTETNDYQVVSVIPCVVVYVE
jgi:hypothetical protein